MSDPWAAPEPIRPSGSPPGDEGAEFVDAPTGLRFLAYLVDTVAVTIAIVVGLLVLMLPFILASPEGFDSLLGENEPLFDIVARVGGFGISVLYGSVFEGSSWKATPGKLLFGLQVRDLHDRPLDFSEALKRNAVKMLMLSCCGLLAFTALMGQGVWNEQTRHRVVKRVG